MMEVVLTSKEVTKPPPLPPLARQAAALQLHNALWFVRLRWLACVGVLLSALTAALAPQVFRQIGLFPPRSALWVALAVIVATNSWFHFHSRAWRQEPPEPTTVVWDLWAQTVFDLVLLTGLLVCVRGFGAFVAWLYALHVVLAGMFFTRNRSFLVTILASALFAVGMVLTHPQPRQELWQIAATIAGTAGVWLVIWHIVSSLSRIVWKRNRELDLANQRLELADRDKSQYVVRTVHDLKSPLSGINHSISLIRMQNWDSLPAAAREDLERIEIRARVLGELVQDTDLLHRLRAEPRSEPVRVPLRPLLKEIVETVEWEYEERQLTCAQDVGEEAVATDPRQLRLLLTQLIVNAARYSPPGKTVRIATHAEEIGVQLQIRDAGIGIAPEALPHLGEEYFRTAEARRFNPIGTGLGLAIVAQIARHQGIGVQIASEPGVGTTVTLALPIRLGTTNL